jgi:hypothetical protein
MSRSRDLGREEVVRPGRAEPGPKVDAPAQDLLHELREGRDLFGAELALVTGQGGPAGREVLRFEGHLDGQEAGIGRRPGDAAFPLGQPVLR